MPGAVFPCGGGGGGTVPGLFPPPQLAISKTRIPASRTGNAFFLRRAAMTTPNGANTNAKNIPAVPSLGALLLAARVVVFTVTVKLAGDPCNVTDAGLTEQVENRGKSWHPNASVPLNPNLGVTTRL